MSNASRQIGARLPAAGRTLRCAVVTAPASCIDPSLHHLGAGCWSIGAEHGAEHSTSSTSERGFAAEPLALPPLAAAGPKGGSQRSAEQRSMGKKRRNSGNDLTSKTFLGRDGEVLDPRFRQLTSGFTVASFDTGASSSDEDEDVDPELGPM
eukprot:COSAG04_NODE_11441_length_708_cov_75.272578_2_plen_151_part_01